MAQAEFTEHVLQIIKRSISAQNESQIKAESEALDLLISNEQFIPALFQICQNPAQEHSAIQYTLVLLKSIANQCATGQIEQVRLFASTIILFFEMEHLERHKKILIEILKLTLVPPFDYENRKDIGSPFHSIFKSMFDSGKSSTESLHQMSLKSLENQLIYFNICFNTESSFADQQTFYLDYLTRVWDVLLGYIMELALEKYNDSGLRDPANLARCLSILKATKVFGKTLKEACAIFFAPGSSFSRKYQYLYNLFMIPYQLTTMQIGSLGTLKNNFFKPTSNPDINTLVLKIRRRGLANYISLSCLLGSLPRDILPEDTFDRQENYTRLIIQCLLSVMNFKSMRECYELQLNPNTANLMMTAINFLNYAAEVFEYYELFAEKKNDLIIGVVYPLMATTPQRIHKSEDQPDEFIQEEVSKCGAKKVEIIACNASIFLDTLCYKIDGAMTIAVQTLLEMIKFDVSLESTTAIGKYPHLAIAAGYPIFTEQTNELRIEFALGVLSGMRDQMLKRDDLFKDLRSFFLAYFNTLVNSTGIIKFRFILFSIVYIAAFFPTGARDDQQNLRHMAQVLEWVISNLVDETIVGRIAAKMLLVFLKREKNDKLVFPLVFNQLIEVANKILQTTALNNVFLVLRGVIGRYSHQFVFSEVAFKTTMSNIVHRIIHESKNSTKESNIVITHCFGMILSCASDKMLVTKYGGVFEEMIPPVLQIVDGVKNNIDEDIIELVILFADMSERMPKHSQQLFVLLPKIQSYNDGKLAQIFPLLNRYFVYGANDLTSQHVDQVLYMVRESFAKNSPATKTWEYYDADTLALVQVMLQTVSPLMNNEHWQNIVEVLNRYMDMNEIELKPEVVFLTDKVLGLYLCLLISSPADALSELKSGAKLAKLSVKLFENLNAFQTHYDLKVLTVGVGRIIHLLGHDRSADGAKALQITLHWFIPYLKLNQLLNMTSLLTVLKKSRGLNAYETKIWTDFMSILSLFPALQKDDRYTLSGEKEYDDIDNILNDEHGIKGKEKMQTVSRIVSPILKVDEYLNLRAILKQVSEDPVAWNRVLDSIRGSPAEAAFQEVTRNIEYVYPYENIPDRGVARKIAHIAK